MNRIAAIDPGANGGIAWHDGDGIVKCEKMPESVKEIDELLADIHPSFVYLEKTGGYMPGNSGPAACKFARHCGQLEGLLVGCGIAFESISPQKWMQYFGSLPSDKKERKAAIKDVMQRRYPNCKVTLATSDALGLLTWGLEHIA